MRILITNYSFDYVAKKITFNDYVVAGIALKSILSIINVTTGKIIYNPVNAAKLGSVSGNILTLATTNPGNANTNNLIIYYDDPLALENTNLGTDITRLYDSIDTLWYGTPSVTNVSCTTSATQLLAANANRKGIIFTNTGLNPVYIRIDGQSATTSTGYYLAPNANWELKTGYIPIAIISGIATGGASNIAIQELV